MDGLEIMQENIRNFLREGEFTDQTQACYLDRLSRLSAWLAGHALDFTGLKPNLFLDFLEDLGWGGNGRYSMSNAARSFCRWKYGNKHPILKLKIRRPKPKPERTLDWGDTQQLLHKIDMTTESGVRLQAMLTMMLDAGMRRVEITRAEVKYLDLDKRRLDVMLKGGEWGAATFSPYTVSCIKLWLAVRTRVLETTHSNSGALFVNLEGKHQGQAMNVEGVKALMRRYSIRTEVMFSSHVLRRTFAVLGLKSGCPTRILQRAGRWKNLATVERYSQAIEAVDFLPYSPVMAAVSGTFDQS